MILVIVLLYLLKWKGRLIVVHEFLDLIPVAIAPGAKGCDQEHLIHEVPLGFSRTPLQRGANLVILRVLF